MSYTVLEKWMQVWFYQYCKWKKNKYLSVLRKIRINREKKLYLTSCMSMFKQHTIADFSTSRLFMCCMLVLDTEKENNSAVHQGCWYYEHTALTQPVGLTYWTTWRLITPSALRDRNISSAESQSSQGSWCLLVSSVTKRSGKTQSHYQKDEMQLWQTCQTRKMRHQE